MADLLAGRVSMYMVSYSIFDKLDKVGKLKVIGSATQKRLSVRPDLPTISESGVPGYTVNVWFGMAAPTGTPDAVLDTVHADVVKILRSDEFKEKVVNPHAFEVGGISRAEFADELKRENIRWGELVRNSGAKLD